MAKYEFDKENFDIKKVSRSFSNIIWRVVKWIVVSASFAIVYYVIASLFISTSEERRLRRENKMYEKLYSQLEDNQKLVGDVVQDLQARDNAIYNKIFHTESPSADLGVALGYSLSDVKSTECDVFEYIGNKIPSIELKAANVEANMNAVFSIMASRKNSIPPLASPVENINYSRIGASVGQKINPFYKVKSEHNGLDIIAGQGDVVKAAAGGVVKNVIHSGKGLGNVVEIDHGNGYITKYAHLGNVSVSKGRKLDRGIKIGSVGVSGSSFAPHLHYEVLKDGKIMDPINYMFYSLSPKEYVGVAYMALSTEQSLD